VSDVSIYATDQNGGTSVGIAAQSPGFPVLAFFPFTGNTLPQPPPSFNFTDNAFYTTVRVLPFDNQVPQQFIDLWNSTHDPNVMWQFVYNNILYVYDMLFNVMLEYVNLGSQKAFDNNLQGIWNAILEEAALESTYAMPITRDLSEGKRATLQLYIYLAANNFNLNGAALSAGSIPAGWAPPK
jgi:hypothetical protein